MCVKRSVMADLTQPRPRPRPSTTHHRLGLKLSLESLASSSAERPRACVVQWCASGDSAPGLVGHEGAGNYGAVHKSNLAAGIIQKRTPLRVWPFFVFNAEPNLVRSQSLNCNSAACGTLDKSAVLSWNWPGALNQLMHHAWTQIQDASHPGL
jgi:hypothetical protein